MADVGATDVFEEGSELRSRLVTVMKKHTCSLWVELLSIFKNNMVGKPFVHLTERKINLSFWL